MDKGLSFTYSTTAFPRYHFFQQRLQRLVPRWQKILDAGSLADCKSQGRGKLKEISADVQLISDQINVSIFADPAYLRKRKFDLPKESSLTGNVGEENLKWSHLLKELRKTVTTQLTFIIVVARSLKKIHKDLAPLPEPLLKDVIIYNDQTKEGYLYTELAPGDDVKGVPVGRKITLGGMIQYLLEEKVVTILENITEYNHEFIPRQGEEVDSSLLDSIHLQMIKSLQDQFVVKDLEPDVGASMMIPSDRELMQIAETVGKNWEVLGISLGLTNLEIENIKVEAPAVHSRINSMLQRWKKKNGVNATKSELQDKLEQMKIDISPIRSLLVTEITDAEKDEMFHKKLIDFIAKKTKCVACEVLSKKYGISASLVNEFFNVGFYDYETKVTEVLKASNLPKWSQHTDSVMACRVFSYSCSMTLTKTIHNAEDYIRTKIKVLNVLKKLQYEIFGQLSLSEVPLHVEIPKQPKLPLELQYELLGLEVVTGCGICYGDLLLHVKKTLFPAQEKEIRDLLKQYKFVGGFKSQVMEEKDKQEQALGLLLEQGQELRARKQGENGHSHGSLGCFVRIKPKIDPTSVDQSQPGSMVSTAYEIKEEKDHCLTCAHCLNDCELDVEVRSGNGAGFRSFGVRRCLMYEPEALDVASVEIFDEKLNNCDSKLKRSDRIPVENWRIFEFNPLYRDVHKEGCCTQFTRGLVMSTDYMTERMMEYNIRRFQETRSFTEHFHTSYNILIESLPAAGNEIQNVLGGEPEEPFVVPRFSDEGDSGSVVIADDPDTVGSVNVVALLMGAVGRQNIFLHSYGSLMNRTIAEIEEHYNCIVTPSRLPPGGNVLEGAVGGGAVLQGQLQ